MSRPRKFLTLEEKFDSLVNHYRQQYQNDYRRGRRSRSASHMDDLSAKELAEIYEKQGGLCFYTGLPLVVDSYLHIRKVPHLHRVSIDRIDSSQPYTKENIVLCSTMVNMMKQSYSQEDFLKVCHLVVKQFPKESESKG